MPDRNDETPRKDHLFMFGELTPERAQEIAERILADWSREYTLFINSDGGSSFDALALANLLKNARFLERLNDVMAEMLARDTGRPKDDLTADMMTDHYLFGQEIIDYGLADGFYESPAQPARRRRAGHRVPETFERPARVKDSG